jgi:hypothetical protein
MSAIDFSKIVSGAGIQLEQAAYNKFGAAVDQFTRAPFSDMITARTSSFGGLDPHFRPDQKGIWRPANYAQDLITYQPKHRFMFRVLFEMNPNFTELIGGRKDVFQYVIKNIDRPKLNFDYEAVNMYNYKTKVLKTINHEPLSMTLIDDIADTFHAFFAAYLRAHSPAARSWTPEKSLAMMESSGMAFSKSRDGTQIDSAARGALPDDAINPFRSIRLIQYFGHATQLNTFWFVNPRILDISYDSADNEGGDVGNHATIRFDYDALSIGQPTQVTGRSEYAAPGSDMFSPEIPVQNIGFPSPHWYGDSAGPGGFGGGGGWLGNVLSGVVGGAVNQVASGIVGNIKIPILGQAARNVVFGASRQITNTTRNTLFGVTGGLSSAISNSASSAGRWISDSVSNMGKTSPPVGTQTSDEMFRKIREE